METMKELGKGLSWASSTETLLATVEEALDQLKSVANSANKTKQPITDYDIYVKRVEEEAAITDKGWLEAGRRAGLFQPSRGIALVLFWELPEEARTDFLKRYAVQLNDQQWEQLALNLKQFQLGPLNSFASEALTVAKKWLLGLSRARSAKGQSGEMKPSFEMENVLLRLAGSKVWLKYGSSHYEGRVGQFDHAEKLAEDIWRIKFFRLKTKGDTEIMFPGNTLANRVEKPMPLPLPLLHVYRQFAKPYLESKIAFELPDNERFQCLGKDESISIDHPPGSVCGHLSGWGDGMGQMGATFLFIKEESGKMRRIEMSAIAEIRLENETGEVIFSHSGNAAATP